MANEKTTHFGYQTVATEEKAEKVEDVVDIKTEVEEEKPKPKRKRTTKKKTESENKDSE